ncbi:hypothetical protein Pmar_PMAR011111 [Perkinsus marinus ATCC 50983]|uniref:Uncharacterized protein n=1 Tax=Perkinsus marinus (strain ATCC 50983 / TXsc) TaxID=423536 RepID=C5KVR0_PERM5|nr:hypothetical protein Pmar_PMAR011111 [Perkinsus marinus ATCC 50983]EER11445.1 hypothetical protein Pmar_PMAR011111 [Perkinsus marinus ATCC 50983]|eukprot:XP_002779650.1 hypothetical protein Pmar_PMAR011111 [Perkinsus marinus ATCC 50983]
MDMDTNDYDDDDDVSLVHRYHLCDATNKDVYQEYLHFYWIENKEIIIYKNIRMSKME